MACMSAGEVYCDSEEDVFYDVEDDVDVTEELAEDAESAAASNGFTDAPSSCIPSGPPVVSECPSLRGLKRDTQAWLLQGKTDEEEPTATDHNVNETGFLEATNKDRAESLYGDAVTAASEKATCDVGSPRGNALDGAPEDYASNPDWQPTPGDGDATAAPEIDVAGERGEETREEKAEDQATKTDERCDGDESDIAERSGAQEAREAGENNSCVAGSNEAECIVEEVRDEELLRRAEVEKKRGNEAFKEGDFSTAEARYTAALQIAPFGCRERAVYFGNLSACSLQRGQYAYAVQYASSAIDVDPQYVKAYARRAMALEKLDELDRALGDAQAMVQIQPDHAWAEQMVARLQPIVTERQEKLKEEMLAKLKDLGNTVLGKFGMSLDNFKAEKDPVTGGYSLKFQQ